jgi:hypothetical protein
MLPAVITNTSPLLKSASIFVFYCFTEIIKFQLLTVIINKQIYSATAEIKQILSTPSHESDHSTISEPPTIFSGDGQTALNPPISTVSLAIKGASSRMIVSIPPHPNFAANAIDCIDLNIQPIPDVNIDQAIGAERPQDSQGINPSLNKRSQAYLRL